MVNLLAVLLWLRHDLESFHLATAPAAPISCLLRACSDLAEQPSNRIKRAYGGADMADSVLHLVRRRADPLAARGLAGSVKLTV
jgi:hypothetical protein